MLSCPGWLQKGLLPIFKTTKKIRNKYNPKIQNQNCRVWKIQLVGFVFFSYFFCKNTKKYEKHTNRIPKKYTLYFCIFFCIFPLRPKMQFVFLYFFCIFPVLHRLHFVLLYFFVL